MACRVLYRFRSAGIRDISSRHNLSPRFNINLHEIFSSSIASHFRRFSDAAQPLKENASSSAKPPVTDNSGVNNDGRRSFKSSLSQPELLKFSAIADTWWDAEGPFKPLHALNPARLAFIRLTLCDHFGKDPNSVRPFEGLKFADVGCGGGILSEPLARMGASVTGIDAVEKNIKIASLHAELDPVTSSIEYQCTTAENQQTGGSGSSSIEMELPVPVPPPQNRQNSPMSNYTLDGYFMKQFEKGNFNERLVEEKRQFDAVLSLEVVEHVADPAEFCKSLAALTVPNGALVISTINRSMRAYAGAIVAAEYLLQWLPKGTHEWSKFLTPEEIVLILNRASISVKEMAGFVCNPLTGRWSVSDDIGVNFIGFGIKNVD